MKQDEKTELTTRAPSSHDSALFQDPSVTEMAEKASNDSPGEYPTGIKLWTIIACILVTMFLMALVRTPSDRSIIMT